MKGKIAIESVKKFRGKQKNSNGDNFWVHGHFLSTIGLDKMVAREYIRDEEKKDWFHDQIKLSVSRLERN